MADGLDSRRLSTGSLGNDMDNRHSTISREDAAFSSVHTGTPKDLDLILEENSVEAGGAAAPIPAIDPTAPTEPGKFPLQSRDELEGQNHLAALDGEVAAVSNGTASGPVLFGESAADIAELGGDFGNVEFGRIERAAFLEAALEPGSPALRFFGGTAGSDALETPTDQPEFGLLANSIIVEATTDEPALVVAPGKGGTDSVDPVDRGPGEAGDPPASNVHGELGVTDPPRDDETDATGSDDTPDSDEENPVAPKPQQPDGNTSDDPVVDDTAAEDSGTNPTEAAGGEETDPTGTKDTEPDESGEPSGEDSGGINSEPGDDTIGDTPFLAPALAVSDATGSEDRALALDIAAAVTDPSETLSITVGGLPEGASLSAGTAGVDGSWTLAPGELEGLTLTPPADYAGRFELAVTATATDGADSASTVGNLAVEIASVADAPVMAVSDATGFEDRAVALDIAAAVTDPSETLSITVGGLPGGASLSAGTAGADGSWTLAPGELEGLTLTPPADFAGRFELAVTATATDGADEASITNTLAVAIAPVADTPNLNVTSVSGFVDRAIPLDLFEPALFQSDVLTDLCGKPRWLQEFGRSLYDRARRDHWRRAHRVCQYKVDRQR